MKKKAGNKFVIACHLDDLNFLLENYANISMQCIKEFELPVDTIVKLRPKVTEEVGVLRTFFNGEECGNILIKDAPVKKALKKDIPDRGLH